MVKTCPKFQNILAKFAFQFAELIPKTLVSDQPASY